jgi:predicted Zn-dependent peptidase
VSGGINLLGNMFNINGPVLWTVSLFHDAETSADEILKTFDAEAEKLRAAPVDADTLELARIKMRSSLYGEIESFFGFGRTDLLASFALFDDDPGRINTLEAEFDKVTPELLQATAKEYLRPTNRTILEIVPKPKQEKPAGDSAKPEGSEAS